MQTYTSRFKTVRAFRFTSAIALARLMHKRHLDLLGDAASVSGELRATTNSVLWARMYITNPNGLDSTAVELGHWAVVDPDGIWHAVSNSTFNQLFKDIKGEHTNASK